MDEHEVPSLPAAGPVFPLPGVTLFPYQPLPLHIFEPRYRRMAADALADARMIAVAQMQPADPDRPGEERYHPVAGVGRIIQHERGFQVFHLVHDSIVHDVCFCWINLRFFSHVVTPRKGHSREKNPSFLRPGM